MQKSRPFLKWAGNKYRCLTHILPVLPSAPRLIEPFAGSAAIFMNTQYQNYLLGEENEDLVNLFQHLKEEGESFIDYCSQYFNQEYNERNKFYELRSTFNQCIEKRQRAAIFLYLNRHGYNGLCRYNADGGFNVPFGSRPSAYFPRKEMEIFHLKSQTARFVRADFRLTFAEANTDDVIYCDPPYVPLSNTANFTSYTDKKFGELEQLALAELAMEHANKGGTVLISNHDTPLTRHYYRFAEIHSFSVSRLISCNSDNRLPAPEILAVFR